MKQNFPHQTSKLSLPEKDSSKVNKRAANAAKSTPRVRRAFVEVNKRAANAGKTA